MFKASQMLDQILDGKYRIDKKLGQGGMGAVFLATHIGTKRPIALKIIAPPFMTNTNFVERFKREAEAMGRLRHPNVVNVTDFGFANINDEEVAYMVMEYLDGSDLGDFLKKQGKLSLDLIVDIVEQVCLAIDKAHQQGIIHRDLKPDNIWLEPNGRGSYNIKVLDFGLAKLRPLISSINDAQEPIQTLQETSITTNQQDISYTEGTNNTNTSNHSDELNEAITIIKKNTYEENTHLIKNSITSSVITKNTLPSETSLTRDLTQVGDVLGTPRYMSPEQCSGEQELDGRSDLYSLGVIIYQMLAGETPFRGSVYSLIVHHTTTPPPPLQDKVNNIPKAVSKLVMSTLAKDPKDRPPNAMAFATAFRANANGESALLRQAISLYSNHFFQFIHVAFLGYTPMILGIVAFFMGMLVPMLHKPLIIFSIVSYFLFAQIVNNAVTGSLIVAMVAHFIESPLLPFDNKPVYEMFKSRFKAFFNTSVIAHKGFFFFVATPIVINTALPFNPDSWLYWAIILVLLLVTGLNLRKNFLNGMWLYTPVAIWENYQGQAAIERSKVLVERLEGSIGKIFPLFVFVIINVSILAIMLGWSFLKHISNALIFSDIIIETVTISLGIVLSIIICTMLCPMIGIGYALFYIRARQSGGEWSKGVKL